MDISIINTIIAGICVVGVVAFVLSSHWSEQHGDNHF